MKRSNKPINLLNDDVSIVVQLKAEQKDDAPENEKELKPARGNNTRSKKDDKSRPQPITLSVLLEYKPSIIPNFSPERKPFCQFWQECGLTIKGNYFQDRSGFDQSNYTKARRGERKINASQLIAACLLSRVTVQEAFDIFHLCEHTDELQTYGYEAAVLCYFLDEYHTHKYIHYYDELIWYTIKLENKAGNVLLPKMHRRHRRWVDMKRDIDDNLVTVEAVRKRQKEYPPFFKKIK